MPNATYKSYLASDLWADRRWCALERVKHACQRCFRERATEVHHLTYARVFNERTSDLMPVCRSCHRVLHGHPPCAANDNLPSEQIAMIFGEAV